MSEASVLLWGGRGSGKSGFIGALWHAGGSHDDGRGRWCISPGDLHDALTKNYLIEVHAMLRDGHIRATMPAAEYPYLRLTARRWVSGSPRAALDLAFKDPAGEYADDAMRARQQGSGLLDELLSTAGVVWLFDCVTEKAPQLDQIIRQLGSLRERTGGRPVRTPVAFCLSRIDLLGEEARRWVIREPEKALREHLGHDVMRQLEGTFTNRRYFAVSSKGYSPGTVEPVGLNDVLDWIHGNQRRARLASYGRQWGRRAVVAAVLLIMVFTAVRAVDGFLYGGGVLERQQRMQQALGQLELAERLNAEGHGDSAWAVLKGAELPERHERAVELDTVLAFLAHQVGMARMINGEDVDSMFDVVVDRGERALRTLQDTEAVARVRYVIAETCILKKCELRRIRGNLEYVVEHSRDEQLVRSARERIASLKR
ncbi:hypothetical protein BH23GEM9_BH23GEM9_17490 [soil metagenome]